MDTLTTKMIKSFTDKFDTKTAEVYSICWDLVKFDMDFTDELTVIEDTKKLKKAVSETLKNPNAKAIGRFFSTSALYNQSEKIGHDDYLKMYELTFKRFEESLSLYMILEESKRQGMNLNVIQYGPNQ